MSLKTALAGMANLPQFLVWRLTWDANAKKYAKVPIHVQSPSYPADASKPENWLSFDLSQQWTAYLNSNNTDADVRYTMGFYFTPTCGYWFLDVDNAQIDGALSPIAQDIYTRLSGAAFEWSSSAKGYHLFGRGAVPSERQIKPVGTGLELYTEGRGVAFGLSGEATGSANIDFTEQMANVVANYFPPVEEAKINNSDDDFETPREDYYCTYTDEELLLHMRQRISIEAKFNVNKPTFADLYDGNMEILKAYYKDDESAMDMGLAQNLAYWTGCHAPRMEMFMRQSALARPKWDEHKTYLRERTIRKACERQVNVFKMKPPPKIEEPIKWGEKTDDEENFFLGINEQKKLFEDCVYVIDRDEFYVPLANGAFRLLGHNQFNNMFGRYVFKMSLDNGQGSTSKKADEAFLKSHLFNSPKVDFIKFDPTKTPISIFEEQGIRYLNSYDPTPIEKCEGDASLFVDLITKNYPDGNDSKILISWMAACVQYPGQKFMWAPVLQGGQGIGKTTITECLKYAVGKRFVVTPKASELGAKFNAWIEHALLVVINEMKQDRETEGEVKKLVTDTDVIVEAKGFDQRMTGNYANFIFTLNDKWDFRKSKGDRRFCVMYSKLQESDDRIAVGLNDSYFNRMQQWLKNENGYAIVANYLNTYLIAEEFNPAKGCLHAPDSSSEEEVLSYSIGKVEMLLREAVSDAEPGFKGGWMSSSKITKLLRDNNINNIDNRLLIKYLTNMGYKKHPLLPNDGRLGRMIIEEGSVRIRPYCTNEVIKLTENLNPSEIADAYIKAQYANSPSQNDIFKLNK